MTINATVLRAPRTRDILRAWAMRTRITMSPRHAAKAGTTLSLNWLSRTRYPLQHNNSPRESGFDDQIVTSNYRW
jgi:hypothetical protein